MRCFALLALALACFGCALSPAKQHEVVQRIATEQDQVETCRRADHCALASPLDDLRDLDAHEQQVLALEQGADSLRLRLHLIRSARRSIEVQTFIWGEGISSSLLLEELLVAARRGVRVRLLVDHLLSLDDSHYVAYLALAHRNFELRYYNPVFGRARTQPWQYAAGVFCCFNRFNHRMHNKLFSVDDRFAIIGGRNYRDSYFDLDRDFAYYDRELFLAGPVVREMVDSFEWFWDHPVSVPSEALRDVGRNLLRRRERESEPAPASQEARGQLARMAEQAGDTGLIRERFVDTLMPVASIQFVSDHPAKLRSRAPEANAVSGHIAELLRHAQREVVVQTPYLVLGRDSRQLYRQRRDETPGLDVRVSTNSLAATDAFPVYALSYKYKKRYLRDLGFVVYEFRPDPADAADMVEGAVAGEAPRISMHAKSLVVDRHTSLIGTHNFDPRSDRYNTESAIIIRDAGFAERLLASIERDMDAGNSWLVAKRERGLPPFYRISRFMESVSTALPLFDLWPFRYASNFEPLPGCPPLRHDHPDFYRCHRDVGNFPGENSIGKQILTRLITAFGAPLLPVL